jgi:hypothetical protein
MRIGRGGAIRASDPPHFAAHGNGGLGLSGFGLGPIERAVGCRRFGLRFSLLRGGRYERHHHLMNRRLTNVWEYFSDPGPGPLARVRARRLLASCLPGGTSRAVMDASRFACSIGDTGRTGDGAGAASLVDQPPTGVPVVAGGEWPSDARAGRDNEDDSG